MKNTTYNLNVLRGAKYITGYAFTGTKLEAVKMAKYYRDTVHQGAVVSVENMDGTIVGVAK